MENNELDKVLLNVRKSYRLLFDFQTRILDLSSFIAGKFGFSYAGGYPKFSNVTPRVGSGNLTNWAWDWLNMYYYEFHFGIKESQSDKLYFSIFLVCDTGFFEVRDINNVTKLDVSSFKNAESSSTKLIFVVGKNFWDGWGVNWDETDFILKEQGEKKGNSIHELMIFKSYDLSLFSDELNTIEVLRDFEKYCILKSVNFKILDRV